MVHVPAGPPALDEVNFWQPSAHGFNAPPGTPFFFKLKSPHNAIGGFGIFARYEAATVRLAWEAFGEKNGAASLDEMATRVGRYARRDHRPRHRVGCIMVAQPVFFADGDWVEQPRDWVGTSSRARGTTSARARAAASGRSAGPDARRDERAAPALRLAARLRGTAIRRAAGRGSAPGAGHLPGRGHRGLPRRVRRQRGALTSGARGGAHSTLRGGRLPQVTNGLLLRADIHRLFDKGYVTVTPAGHFLVSQRLAQEWENGKAYYAIDGSASRPGERADQPDAALLRWHNDKVFEKDAA